MIKLGEHIYYHAIICLNGHVISDSVESVKTTLGYCKYCGKPTSNICENCKNPIRGDLYSPGFINAIKMKAPSYCYGCGNPYPWTKTGIDALKEFIDFEEKLSNSDKEKLKKNIDDIINETPRTQIASIYFRKMLTDMKKETARAAKDVINKIAVEQAKETIFAQINTS